MVGRWHGLRVMVRIFVSVLRACPLDEPNETALVFVSIVKHNDGGTMTDVTPARKSRIWLLVAGILAVVAIAILWPLQGVGQVCIMIYPAPPGCFAEEPRWVPLAAIAIIIGLVAAMVVVAFVMNKPRTALILLTSAIVVVCALAVFVVWLSQTGIWDPYQPQILNN